MKIGYLEPFSGASGDMILGALLDAGVDLHELVAELGKLGLPEVSITAGPVSQHGLGGTHAVVAPEVGHHARSWRDIRALIANSAILPQDKATALQIFTNLAEAEATVHGVPVDDVHFHEVGALDTIVDIVGAVIGLRMLGIEKLFSAALHVGGGTVRAAHGVMPVPAPATARLLAMTGSVVASPNEWRGVCRRTFYANRRCHYWNPGRIQATGVSGSRTGRRFRLEGIPMAEHVPPPDR